ncbi:hypothetical protein [Brevibacillus daliensis]|uniref:hypothetical protein n=1 Tax=Brevibacillus daliensis TaxID=2892995 RepID=UPI001E393F4D|nr:hypothetical protein [Brevibacillus daliensis]
MIHAWGLVWSRLLQILPAMEIERFLLRSTIKGCPMNLLGLAATIQARLLAKIGLPIPILMGYTS